MDVSPSLALRSEWAMCQAGPARGTSSGHIEMFLITSSQHFASNYSDAQDALKQKRYLRRAGSSSNPFLLHQRPLTGMAHTGRKKTAHDSLDTSTVVVHPWERPVSLLGTTQTAPLRRHMRSQHPLDRQWFSIICQSSSFALGKLWDWSARMCHDGLVSTGRHKA